MGAERSIAFAFLMASVAGTAVSAWLLSYTLKNSLSGWSTLMAVLLIGNGVAACIRAVWMLGGHRLTESDWFVRVTNACTIAVLVCAAGAYLW